MYLQVLITAEIIDNFLEDFKEGFFSFLYLTITLWEVGATEVVTNVEGYAQFFHVFLKDHVTNLELWTFLLKLRLRQFW